METDSEFKFSHDSMKSSQFNFNTLIGLIALGALTWMGNKVVSSADVITKIETTLPYVTQSVTDLKTQISQLVTRSEMESRFSELAAKNAVLDARLMKLEYEKKRDLP